MRMASLPPLVIAGCSGAGKGTLIAKLTEWDKNSFGFSVSHTTRDPRPGEVDGQHYHFTDNETMKRDIAAGLFLESACVHGNYYGTSKAAVEEVQDEGKICILDIDVQGVRRVKASTLSCKYLWIEAPDFNILEARLRSRGTESEEKILRRLGNAKAELAYARAYNSEERPFDAYLINDDLDTTFAQLLDILADWYPHIQPPPKPNKKKNLCTTLASLVARNPCFVPSFVEKYIVLIDNCEGLLAKTCRLAKTLRSEEKCYKSLKNPEWKGIRSKLLKSFPEVADLTRDPKYESFKQGAAATTGELKYAYELFQDVGAHCQLHLETARSMLAQSASWEANSCRDIVRNACHLFCAYCRLHFMLAMIEQRKQLCSLFAAAHYALKGSSEPRFSRLAMALRTFDEPVRALTEQFREYAKPLAEIVAQSLPTVALGANGAGDLVRRSALSAHEDTASLGSPCVAPLNARDKTGRSLHAELLVVRETCDFCVFATIACPGVLAESPAALNACRAACCDALVVAVFRGTSLNVHAELEGLGKWYPPRSVKQWPRDLKLAKLFKDWSKEAVTRCGLRHRERRAYLLGELEILDGLVAACPALAAPKAPLCAAAVSLALDETAWVLRHSPAHPAALPPKTRLKHYSSDHYNEPRLALLAGTACRLCERLRRTQRIIGDYYVDFLAGADARALEALAPLAARALPTDSSRKFREFFAGLPERLRDPELREDAYRAAQRVTRDGVFVGGDHSAAATRESRLASLRLDWRRVASVACASTRAGSMLKDDGVTSYLRRANLALLDRARLADGSQLARSCDFGALWPFRAQLVKAFEESLARAGAWAAHALRVLVVVARDAMRASAHPAAPEDGQEIAVEARAFGEAAAADKCGAAIRACLAQLAQSCSGLAEQIAPVQAAYRLERRDQAQRDQAQRGSGSGGGERPADEPAAGYESLAANAKLVDPIAVVESRLASLMAACRDDDFGTVVIHDTIFRPSEFAKSAVLVFLQHRIPQCFFDESGKTLHRPTAVERSIQAALSAAERAATYVDVDYAAYVASLVMDPGRSEEPAQRDDDGAPKPLSRGHAPIAEAAAQFYTRLVRRLPPGTVYCPPRNGFKPIAPTSDDAQSVEKYLSSHELEAYVRVVGADGARCLDRALTAAAVDEMALVKKCVCSKDAAFTKCLEKIRLGFLNGDWVSAARELGERRVLDSLLAAATRLGNVLELRRLVRAAAARAADRAAPHLAAAARLALDAAKADPATIAKAPDWLLASADAFQDQRDPTFAQNGDFDCPPYERDSALYDEAKALLESPDEWRLLPYAFAASLLAETGLWLPDLEALDNGAHVTSAALKALAHCFNGLPPHAPNAAKQAKAVVARFLEAAAAMLNWMRIHEKDFADLPVRAMAAYLEYVARDAAIPRSFLEKHLPYAVIHASLMDIAMGRQTAADEKKTPFVTSVFDVGGGES
ncbi:hypothetical protein CTAYLR_006889 [Chrysophaeum taylorii]|uniref:guanylate kinase n=1 Tax=Chrysophaeum taylorii TaxID=2483200 RepID=A0AAD7XMV8_9STRA|nr:hypothetical protein CTAYLR_006889 [Chrysophaeum taylorii]